MKLRELKSVLVVIVVLICICIVAWLGLITDTVLPGVEWNLSGRVIDFGSNGVPNVIITATGGVRVTAFNKIFRVKPEEFSKTAKTDKDGEFSLKCTSYGFDVLFQKEGYTDFSTNFGYYPDLPGGTDRVFTVQLLQVHEGVTH
jgi:hypothetical protein